MRPILLFAALTALAGCNSIEEAPPPAHPHSGLSETTTDSAVVTASPTTTGTTATTAKTANANDKNRVHDPDYEASLGAIIPRASVERADPEHAEFAKQIVAASAPALKECRANSGGGTLRVVVVQDKSSNWKIDHIESDSKIGDQAKHCALEALSTADPLDTLSRSSASMNAPSGHTSIIAINW